MSQPGVLPHWDVSDVFPSLDSHEFVDATELFGADIARLCARFAAWVRVCGADAMIATGPVAAAHAWPLRRTAVRGLNTHNDPTVRAAGYDAEMKAWPNVSVTLAHAMNALKGEANIVNQRRSWANPLDASRYANSVDRPTYEAMTSAVRAALPDLRRWMRCKAELRIRWRRWPTKPCQISGSTPNHEPANGAAPFVRL